MDAPASVVRRQGVRECRLAPEESIVNQHSSMAAMGIHCIDTGLQRPGFDAAWLLVDNGRAAFIDCGTSHAVPQMMQALADRGLTPEAVDWLILTHVHLDHAGGAGALLARLPNARVLVHPRGVPHMIDPSRLVAGATAVYGAEEMARTYGSVLPVPEARVETAAEGQRVRVGGRTLECADTPGHARHHICLFDAHTASWFTGDTFGIAYAELAGAQGRFIIPTSSPVQFEPEALKDSIRRLMARQPQAMHLTHYGTVEDPAPLAGALLEQIDAMVAIGQASAPGPGRQAELEQALSDYYGQRAEHAGLDRAAALEALSIDITLNAQGLICWLERGQR